MTGHYILQTNLHLLEKARKPNIWIVLFPTMFSGPLARSGPKHSTSVPFSAGVAVPLSVDVKEVALVVPNPVPVVKLKGLPDPHGPGTLAVLCSSEHSLLPPPTLQMVTPFLSPVAVHLKVKVSPGQVGGAALNCPATSGWQINCTVVTFLALNYHNFEYFDAKHVCIWLLFHNPLCLSIQECTCENNILAQLSRSHERSLLGL